MSNDHRAMFVSDGSPNGFIRRSIRLAKREMESAIVLDGQLESGHIRPIKQPDLARPLLWPMLLLILIALPVHCTLLVDHSNQCFLTLRAMVWRSVVCLWPEAIADWSRHPRRADLFGLVSSPHYWQVCTGSGQVLL